MPQTLVSIVMNVMSWDNEAEVVKLVKWDKTFNTTAISRKLKLLMDIISFDYLDIYSLERLVKHYLTRKHT